MVAGPSSEFDTDLFSASDNPMSESRKLTTRLTKMKENKGF